MTSFQVHEHIKHTQTLCDRFHFAYFLNKTGFKADLYLFEYEQFYEEKINEIWINQV